MKEGFFISDVIGTFNGGDTASPSISEFPFSGSSTDDGDHTTHISGDHNTHDGGDLNTHNGGDVNPFNNDQTNLNIADRNRSERHIYTDHASQDAHCHTDADSNEQFPRDHQRGGDLSLHGDQNQPISRTHHQLTAGQNNQESRRKYWATCSLAPSRRSFICLLCTTSFACLLTPLLVGQ